MPTRILREGILTSRRINNLTANGELFYRRLMSVVDDYGRYYGEVALLRAACYPFQLKRIKENNVKEFLNECISQKLMFIYKSNSEQYVQVINTKQQTRSKSKFPEPDNQLLINCESNVHLVVDVCGCEDVVGVGDEVVGTATAANENGKKKKTEKIGFDFEKEKFTGITENIELKWQDAYPAVPIPPEILRAAEWVIANPHNRKSNWRRFLVNWFSRAQNKAGRVSQ